MSSNHGFPHQAIQNSCGMGTVSQGPITTHFAADSMSQCVGFRSSKHFSDLFQNERRTGN